MSSHVFFTAKTTTGDGTDYEAALLNVQATKIKKSFVDRNTGPGFKENPKRIIFITGTFTTGSAKVVVSMDGVIWHDYGSALTAVGFWEIDGPWPFINVNITVATTVSLTATLVE